MPLQRSELAALLAIVLLAMGLRGYALSQSAVEHFDEGVYASNVYFGAPDYSYPQRRFYAPPLLPALIEAGMLAGIAPNTAALLPSFLAGLATIAALWWFGRSWFSPSVGLGAALLAAASDFHVAYSAAALTDVLLGLWLIMAVDAIARSLSANDYRWAILGGIYTGLAWWTKYNGWLPLAIEAAALPLLWLAIRPTFTLAFRWLGCLGVTLIVAAAIWAPYFLSLQTHGGYGPIAANHARYVVGFGNWLGSLDRQIASQIVMEGPLSWTAIGASYLLTTWIRAGAKAFLARWKDAALLTTVFAIVFSLAAWAASAFVVVGLSAIAGLVLEIDKWLRSPVDQPIVRNRVIAGSLLACWFVGLAVATPCYTAYPRLVIPLFLAMCILCAACWDEFARRLFSVPVWPIPRKDSGVLVPPVLLALLLVAAAAIRTAATPLGLEALPSNSRTGYLEAAASLRRQLRPEATPRAIYVYGEPALYFQLRAAGESLVGPVQQIPDDAARYQDREIPTYLVIGPHARQDSQWRSQWREASHRWERVASHAIRPSAIVWLDLFDPRKPKPPDQAEHVIDVYKLR